MERKTKYQKVLKQSFNRGFISWSEYLEELKSIREDEKKMTFFEWIKSYKK